MNAKKIFRSCREQKRHEILWAGSLAKILFTWPEPDISCSIRSVWFPPCWQWGCSGALPKNQKQLESCVFPASERSARSIGRERESASLVQSCHEKVKLSRLKIFEDAPKIDRNAVQDALYFHSWPLNLASRCQSRYPYE